MVDERVDVLRPPHGTPPAAVKANKNKKLKIAIHNTRRNYKKKRNT